jgi:hypothetical protein
MLKFGDVIYRPCLSYAGKKNFVNTQIVLEMITKDNEDYIRSVDFIGQKWTDKISDLDDRIFVDKDEAMKKLVRMIYEKTYGEGHINGNFLEYLDNLKLMYKSVHDADKLPQCPLNESLCEFNIGNNKCGRYFQCKPYVSNNISNVKIREEK